MKKQKKNTGYDALSRMSGLSKDVIKDIAKDVKKNQELLNSCSYHIFEQIDDPHMSRRFICTNCQGVVGIIQKTWYEKGIEHCQKRTEVEEI